LEPEPKDLTLLDLVHHHDSTDVNSHSLLAYEDAMHMDAFSLDHHSSFDPSGSNPLKDPLSASTFGFGDSGMGNFSNAFTSIGTQLERLHNQYDTPE